MSRYARDKSGDHPRPVKQVEVSSDHLVLRIVLFIAAVAIAAVAITFGIRELSKADDGWQAMEVTGRENIAHCGDEFICLYKVPVGMLSSEWRKIKEVYSDACVAGYNLFDAYDTHGIHNLAYVNQHPGETVKVHPALYRALRSMESSGSRALYLGLAYDLYGDLFYAANDDEAKACDPLSDPETKKTLEKIISFVSGSAVQLSFPDGESVCLTVSEPYAAFAKSISCNAYLDFFWMKNAFLADFIADELTSAGYTSAVISSFDGYMRNLYGEEDFSVNLFEKIGKSIYRACEASYKAKTAIVQYRGFPYNEQDVDRFRDMPDGSVRHSCLDPADGVCKACLSEAIFFSESKSCADLLIATMRWYISEQPDLNALQVLCGRDQDIRYLYSKDGKIHTNHPGLKIGSLFSNGEISFQVAQDG
ncbi:MAG: hypothetical protein II715_06090 [Clostridia bacterium]|nr:hypothetical protein [Clostridia bacterium]